jgi:glycine dehydrogenase
MHNTSPERFSDRHIGPGAADQRLMLEALGCSSLDALMDAVVPADIRLRGALDLPAAATEAEALAELRALAGQNRVFRSYIGMGYHDTVTPPVILRNILENPGWYTAYTPYQAEIAQGRLEALLNYQTVVSDLSGLEIANASLLDEATAAAEAMHMTHAVSKHTGARSTFLVDAACHPQTIAVVRTRAAATGVRISTGDPDGFEFKPGVVGCLVQYPATDGGVRDFRPLAQRAHAAGALVTAATDLLALALLASPGEWGADIAVGNSQRFGVPLGFGGPHAAFFATRDQYKRLMPGRIIGVSRDRAGRPGMRMALGTREQHIRREKATSNICTAQVLLAVCAGMYAVWHGPDGIRAIAERVHGNTRRLAAALVSLGYRLRHEAWFDTIAVETDAATARAIHKAAAQRRINLRPLSKTAVGVALDETAGEADLEDLVAVFSQGRAARLPGSGPVAIPAALRRTSPFLAHPVFSAHHSETEMLRYLKRLEDRDLSLTTAMIPLGSCTMKLNATTEMIPVTWREFGGIHPFAPPSQTRGYQALFSQLEAWLNEITGFAATSLQPNAGSQGEFAGLLVIRAYHKANGQGHRTTCLIPASAHGTNPASAVMAGMQVVVVRTNERGEIDLADLRARAAEHSASLGALMVTYPSTHGVFEGTIREVCSIVHEHGGQVYMDGANMNAQVGLCRPGDIGADVCHLNLHKTFCIPHGGGGPGMGPICVAAHLRPYLPEHPVVKLGIGRSSCGTVSAAPWGSPSILPISWAYIRMMGPDGLTDATRVAILSANYVARRLEGQIPTLYSGPGGLVAHECILDTRPFKQSAGVEVSDIAKRLIDYGFHPPTVSFPVAGTLMVEPTESEPKSELDRFCDALIAIRGEIREIEHGEADREDNLLSNSPHPLADLLAEEWRRPYSRERAAFPTPETRDHKIWPPVSRIDDAFGDRNLVCVCPPVEEYAPQA